MGNIFLEWEFKDAPKSILIAWKNFLVFGLDYFSLPILLRTFFSPWKKYSYSYGGIFEIWKNIETLVFNAMSRIIGAIIRFVFIILGIVFEILIAVSGVLVFLGWLVLPFLLIFGLIYGIKLVSN
ncbi:MAG: hypothetical protein A3F95_02700 [Candidatus Nealsonbacteria bacterium RIFCSPLOWO2_12_FULL_39_31]|uniref:Uncharacterized protein n=2 Tax=Candidatus Nealsoniibacteriota TaxID=1817911 RepID=A0A1G2ENK8_9BACT|nr:MAG: hypothetical protein A2626_02065 [Candidatus Nealsonbacteria bacterium RIFCSPHIGHO2_01_FULL_38_55]OGZ20831.1 MAG: hypothetical protein A2W55_01765 [Candidatus Nealsonbacteria bacterium RIFCSPHIGHO2_02_38_10]OGZ27359.1 MAG: hypothetical protein A3F95_02700 [Candidatus Nealsonbacteria bacterium RIFCSPLOWO2_12_FULL_39_31]